MLFPLIITTNTPPCHHALLLQLQWRKTDFHHVGRLPIRFKDIDSMTQSSTEIPWSDSKNSRQNPSFKRHRQTAVEVGTKSHPLCSMLKEKGYNKSTHPNQQPSTTPAWGWCCCTTPHQLRPTFRFPCLWRFHKQWQRTQLMHCLHCYAADACQFTCMQSMWMVQHPPH